MLKNQSVISVELFALHLNFVCVGMKSQRKVEKSHSSLEKNTKISVTICVGLGSYLRNLL